ncbi:VCBS repeat-containing protein [filamentous cyanobacterium LEGE 11480]|uniref:VCBS repeat-containing protein n=1 Tax=Romeriopsis navalis LEGE 11480 TaxID=2777977 RepID=A0A928Z2I0_9CYAN|nr:FG-GAP-like repeat-containing protein [Romeriopsis navalis]MBE9029072.1 VCBS repeat-containing protein [Romeriopsis navalis LEGE 11480]
MHDDLSLEHGQTNTAAQALSTTQAIWHNSLTGDNIWSRMTQSGQVIESEALMRTDLSWKIAATGDFNQDGELDILWRHDGGSLFWWLLKSGKRIDSVELTSVQDQNWQVVGTGDSNRDGQLDILWRHEASGTNSWWIMPETQQRNGGKLAPAAKQKIQSVNDRNWIAAGTGDVNQDGHTDVLWYYRPTGLSLWWQMQQGSITGVSVLNDAIAANETITAVADVNGDGALDLVTQNVTLGTSDLWLMQKPQTDGKINTISRSVITPRFPSGQAAGWQIAGVIDMDAGNSLTSATFEPSGIFSRSQTIGGVNDPADLYLFGLGTAGILSASLSGLSADADVRLIQDGNANGQIDAGEILAWQWERGAADELIEVFLQPGGYFLEVRSYDNQLTNYQLSTGFTATAQAEPKLDIQINFAPTSEPLDIATTTAIESAAVFWERTLMGGGSLVPGGVLPIEITAEDLNLRDGSPDTVTLAFAGPNIVSDGQTLFIQSGNATINRRRLGTIDADSLRNLFIHEFSHVLGFGTIWEPLNFRLGDGTIRQIGIRGDATSLIDPALSLYRADSYAGWAYGELLRDAGFTTETIPTAVPIEAEFFAHWAESVFQTEALTPIASTGLQPISNLTLAAFRDLGWNVNFGAAEAYQLPDPEDQPPVNIDFSNLDWQNAPSRLDGSAQVLPQAKPHQHPRGCGCSHHLMTDRHKLAAIATHTLV